MLRCSAECGFWVHRHIYQDQGLTAEGPCPWCRQPLVEPEPESNPPEWTSRRIGIGPEALTTRGKISPLKIRRVARETGESVEVLTRIAWQGCRGCQERRAAGG